MIIRGKEIKSETITLWLNVLSFFIGILFYLRMGHNASTPTTIIQSNPIKDSVLVIDTQLKMEVQHLKHTQDSLLLEIRNEKELAKTQKKNVTVIRHQLQTTLKSDWDSLNRQQQNAYLQQLMLNLKSKNNK